MKTAYIVAACAALVSGAALEADKVKRAPAASATPGCTPDRRQYFNDAGFSGVGNAWSFDPPTGNLKLVDTLGFKDGYGTNDGLNTAA